MSFYNNGTAGNYLSRADLTDARFSRAAAWSYLIFFKITDTAADDSVLTAKGSNLFYLRTDASASPTRVEMKIHNDWFTATSNDVYQNVWYLAAVRCDGSGNITLSLYDLDTSLIDETTGTRATDHTTENGNAITISRAGSTDPLRGHVAYSCYVKQNISGGDIGAYITNPDSKVTSWGTDVVWYLKMVTTTASELGDDSSGNGNDFTVNGTPTASADDPPITPIGTAFDATVNGKSSAAALLDAEIGLAALAPGEVAPSTEIRFVAGASATGAATGDTAALQNKEQGWTVNAPTAGQATSRARADRSISSQAPGTGRGSIWGHLDKGMIVRLRGTSRTDAQIKSVLALSGPGSCLAINWAALLATRGHVATADGESSAAAAYTLNYGLSGSTVASAGASVPLQLLLSAVTTAAGQGVAGARIVVGELAARSVGNSAYISYLNQLFSLSVISPGESLITAVPRKNAGLDATNDGITATALQLLLQRPLHGAIGGTGQTVTRASVEYTLAAALLGLGMGRATMRPERGLAAAADGESDRTALALALRGHVAAVKGLPTTAAQAAVLRRLLGAANGTGEAAAIAALILSLTAEASPLTMAAAGPNLIAAPVAAAAGATGIASLFSILRTLGATADGNSGASADLVEALLLLGAAAGLGDGAAAASAALDLATMALGVGQGSPAATILNPLLAAIAGQAQAQIIARAARGVAGSGAGDGPAEALALAERGFAVVEPGLGLVGGALLAERGWIAAATAVSQRAAGLNLDAALTAIGLGGSAGDAELLLLRYMAALAEGDGNRLADLRLQLDLGAQVDGQSDRSALALVDRRLLAAVAGESQAQARVYELVSLVGQPASQGNANLLLNLIMTLALVARGKASVDSAAAEIEDANYYTQGQIYG